MGEKTHHHGAHLDDFSRYSKHIRALESEVDRICGHLELVEHLEQGVHDLSVSLDNLSNQNRASHRTSAEDSPNVTESLLYNPTPGASVPPPPVSCIAQSAIAQIAPPLTCTAHLYLACLHPRFGEETGDQRCPSAREAVGHSGSICQQHR